MKIEELIEIYKKDKLFIDFNPSAESEIKELSSLIKHETYEKALSLYLIEQTASKISETAWLYFINQCKKITDKSEENKITISNKSAQYKDCIAYLIDDGKRKHIVAFPIILSNLNVSIEKKEIKTSDFLEDIGNIMLTIHTDVIKNRIENFTKFNSYCEKIKLEKLLSKNINIENESYLKKRL